MVLDIANKAQLDNSIAKCLNMLMVIDFNAKWCGPCQEMKPIFSRMENQYPDVKFVEVDVDKNYEAAEAYGIEALPTFVFLRNGKKIAQFCGTSKTCLRNAIEHLK
ncbi:Thioredoxin [Fasciola gigantica]|uniref:Thioredoxin n=1 Tax=Fasciola gigantica TaxID=46835 RepID=A0A504Y8E2_FASGI|nr:Thioredoxin [Fasciola gigantica]